MTNQIDPKKKYPVPPYPAQSQDYPGIESEMTPLPHYGKESYKGSDKLQGKVAVITGGDSGIGRAVALAYAREGADSIISYLNEDSDAEQIKKDIEAEGRKVVLVRGDISHELQCQKIIEEAVKEFGKVDILVNNAAFQKTYSSIKEIPAEDLEKTFRVNLFAMFHLVKAALPHMPSGGSIINTASIQAYQPSPQLLAYAATKGAIVNFTRGLAQEITKDGIRVNAVAPGPVWTPLIVSTMPQGVPNFGKDSLFGRAAQPAELAPLYVWLASEEASFVSGQVYGATGQAMP